MSKNACKGAHVPNPVTVQQTRHMQDSQGQILALAFTETSVNAVKLFPLRSEAGSWRCLDFEYAGVTRN